MVNGSQVVKLSIPISPHAPSGYLKVTTNPLACNDAKGMPISLSGSSDSVLVVGSLFGALASTKGANGDNIEGSFGQNLAAVVYPNPATNQAHLHITGAVGNIEIKVTDLAGKTLFAKQLSSGEENPLLPVSNLTPGFYLINVYDSKKQITLKFVKG
jgi:hypothetical protein